MRNQPNFFLEVERVCRDVADQECKIETSVRDNPINSTECKIVKENKSPVDLTVGQIATRPVITVPPQTHLHEAANVISEKNVSRLLVEKDGEMVGITTETDIFGAIEQFGWIPEPE